MNRLLLSLFLTAFCGVLSAQSITNLMVTADNTVQMDFTSDPPSLITSNIYSFESLAHAEDQNGSILFWVNSDGVYDSNFDIMRGSNVMFANSSSAEMNICPIPGEPLKYYVIYNAETCSSLYYSIVDMSLNNGLGGIEITNELLIEGSYSEGLEVVNIPCSGDYRLLANECYEGFVSFEITEEGFGEQVLLYAFDSGGEYDGRGELDYHNGRIGQAFAYSDKTFLADYSIADNTITNPVELTETWGCGPFDFISGSYGIDFSLTGNKAYITNWFSCLNLNDLTPIPNALMVYDFETGEKSFINAYSSLGQVELGPDGKLYIAANYSWDYDLLVIEDPDSDDPTITEFDLGQTSGLGLSDHIQSNLFSAFSVNVSGNCVGEAASVEVFSVIDAGDLNIDWEVNGEPLDPEDLTNPGLYEFPADEAGTYEISLTVYLPGCTETVEETIIIYEPDSDLLPETITGCEGEEVLIEAPEGLENIEWSTGEDTQSIYVDDPGTITLSGTVSSCELADEIAVDFTEAPTADLPASAGFCEGESIDITATVNAESFEWSTGETESLTVTIDEPGTLTITAYNADCTVEESMFVSAVQMPEIDWPADTTACDVASLTLDAGVGFDQYVWNNVEGVSTYIASGQENVTLQVSNEDCVQTYAMLVFFQDTPTLTVPDDINVCDQASVLLDITTNATSVSWSSGQTTADITVSGSDTYAVTGANGECYTSEEIDVVMGFSPALGLQDIYFSCDGFVAIEVNPAAAESIDWSTGEDDYAITIDTSGNYSVTAVNGDCPTTHDFDVQVISPEELDPIFPNVFTPDGDLYNDEYLLGLREETNMELQVYNRWGNLVFESSSASMGWDGTIGGKDSPAGVYYAVVTFSNLCTGEEMTRSQDVTLLRE